MSDETNDVSKNNKMEEEDFYLSPEGLLVFTEKFHLKRGHCCKSDCKHCPYGYDKQFGTVVNKKSE
ncbi:MAG: hypothetical protein ACI9J3_001326 [Parvicellaceae bacterium]|jgi:hypothetical protein